MLLPRRLPNGSCGSSNGLRQKGVLACVVEPFLLPCDGSAEPDVSVRTDDDNLFCDSQEADAFIVKLGKVKWNHFCLGYVQPHLVDFGIGPVDDEDEVPGLGPVAQQGDLFSGIVEGEIGQAVARSQVSITAVIDDD